MTLEEMIQKVKDTPLAKRPNINHNGVAGKMNDEQYLEHLQLNERYKNLPPPPEPPEMRLDKLDTKMKVVQKGLADLGNLIGKLMRGGLK